MRKPCGRPSLLLACCVGLVSTAVPPPCRSEALYFANGGQMQVPVQRRGPLLWVDTPEHRDSFHVGDFLRVVPGVCPEQEWPRRRDAALAGGADSRFAAAWWALENGLTSESVAMLRSGHASDPKHQPTARLVQTLDRLERPCSDPDTRPILGALGLPCEVARGPHVLLLHQHEEAEAKARVDLLENVTTSYYLAMAADGIDLSVPGRRLVAVYLRDPGDYRAFLRSQGLDAFSTTLGFFHPNFKVMLTSDLRPPEGKAERGADDLTPTDGPGRDRARRRLLKELDARARADGTAAHEMIHLLVIESGLAPDPCAFPSWLHEGLAAQFEVVRGGRWAGVGRANDLRLPDWRSLKTPAGLDSLVRDDGAHRGYRPDFYARSWSLVYFLRKTRGRQFSDFLDLLRVPEPDRLGPAPDRFESEFRRAFGADTLSLESEWRAFMADVLTPLEENKPASSGGGYRAGVGATPADLRLPAASPRSPLP